MLYGSKCWAIKKQCINKMGVVEMRLLRGCMAILGKLWRGIKLLDEKVKVVPTEIKWERFVWDGLDMYNTGLGTHQFKKSY